MYNIYLILLDRNANNNYTLLLVIVGSHCHDPDSLKDFIKADRVLFRWYEYSWLGPQFLLSR